MTTVASQITSPMVVYSIVYSGADQRKHQSSASLGPVNSPHKGPVMWKMVPFDDVIMRKQLPEPMNTQYQLGPEEQTSVKSTIIPIQIIWMCRMWNIMVSTTRHLLPYSSMIWFTEIFVTRPTYVKNNTQDTYLFSLLSQNKNNVLIFRFHCLSQWFPCVSQQYFSQWRKTLCS